MSTTHPDSPARQARYEVHLRDYLAIVFKRLAVVILTAVTVFVFVALPEAKKPRLYRTSASLTVKPGTRSIMGGEAASYYFMSLKDFRTQLHMMQSREVALAVINAIAESRFNVDLLHELGHTGGGTPDRERLADVLRGRLRVEALPDTQLVSVTLTGSEPKLVQRLLHQFCEAYVDYNGERQREHLDDRQRELHDLIPSLEANVEEKRGQRRELIRNSPHSPQALEHEKALLMELGQELITVQGECRLLEAELGSHLLVLTRIRAVQESPDLARAREALASLRARQRQAAELFRQERELVDLLVSFCGLVETAEARTLVSVFRTRDDQGLDPLATPAPEGLEQLQERAALLEKLEELLLQAPYAPTMLDTASLDFHLSEHPVPAATTEETSPQTYQALHDDWREAESDLAKLRKSRSASPGDLEEAENRRDALRRRVEACLKGAFAGLVEQRREVHEEAASLDVTDLRREQEVQAGQVLQAAVAALAQHQEELPGTSDMEHLLVLAQGLGSDLGALISEFEQARVALTEAEVRAQLDQLVEGSRQHQELVQPRQRQLQDAELRLLEHVRRELEARLVTRQRLLDRQGLLQTAIEEQSRKVAGIELAQADLDRVDFDIQTAEELLRNALRERQRAEFDARLQENTVAIAEEPREPTVPFAPDVNRALLVGLVFGLVAGLGLAFLLEYLDDTIKTVSDIDRYVGGSILGAIPTMVGKSAERRDLVTFYDPKSSVSEAFRSIRTSLLFAGVGEPRRSFVVTSVGPKEGKTTISANLAITLAQAGTRTLLVDCDLRRPRVHKAFGLRENLGLTNILVGGGGGLDDYVIHSDIPNLDVLCSGPIPPNPSELVGSREMRTFFEEIQERYEKVIFDTPPLVAVTDGVIIGGMVDGLILAISSAKTTKKLAQRVREQLENVGVPLFGVVLNNVKASHGYYYYSSYYRYYGDETAASKS